MVFHWSLSDSKSLQVSRNHLSILAVLNNAVVWMISTCPPASKFSTLLNNLFITVPKAPITNGTFVAFIFHSFFNSLARSWYLSFFSHSFSFILQSARKEKSTILQILFFYYHFHYYSWFFLGNWKTMEHESDGYANCNRCPWYCHRMIVRLMDL